MPMTFPLDSCEAALRTDDSHPELSCADTDVHPAWQRSAAKGLPHLHHFFERACDARSGSLALIAGDERLTYAALDARANRLAHHLVRRGVRPGDRVGLLLERSGNAYAALLAILKCGAAFVPLDPSFPAERIAFIAEDADFSLLLTTAKFGDAVAGVECPILALDADAGAIAHEPTARPQIDDKGDPLCYVIYTSGTTGRPKGVAIHHGNACNYLRACTEVYGVTPHDRVYQGITFAFDFSVEEIWIAFAAGATLVAGPTDYRRLGAGLNDFLIEQGVTVLGCVPTLLATLERDVPLLRTLIVGGEACPPDLVRRWARPGRRMLNTYGPTETTVTATWAEMDPDQPVTIGKPLPTYTAYILDDQLRPVKDGESGEICIGGPSVAAGYVNRPDLTAEKFISDPFAKVAGGRLYRTGDLGRFTLAGDIEFLGRIDTQVKIRGFRIELGEIEAILLEDPAVANALVALVETEGGTKELAAYLTLRSPVLDAEELRVRLHDTMRRRMPFYMVPAFVEILEVLPTLPSGKADRARLPAPASDRLGALSGEEVPPETPLEHTISASWAKVFGRDNLSVEADFFLDLGGHSLFAARVTSELRHETALRHLAVGDLYAHPTIRGLARYLETHVAQKAVPHAGPRRYSNRRVWTGGAMQLSLLYLFLIPWVAPTALMLLLLADAELPFAVVAGGVAAMAVMAPLVALFLPVAAKWLLLGRVKAGHYPLWGWFFCRWWLVRKLLQTAPLELLAGSPLLPPYLRLLGARVGRGCHLGSTRVDVPDLIDIGDDVSIGYDADLDPSHVADGYLHIGPLHIGDGAYIGTNAMISGDSSVGRGARVVEQSLVANGQTIPAEQTWAGSPAQRTDPDPRLDALAAPRPRTPWPLLVMVGFVAGFIVLLLLPSLLVLPGLLLMWGVSRGDLGLGLALAPAAGLLQVLATCAVVALGKRLALPAARPGVYPVRSAFGLRKWFADRLMVLHLTLTNSLYSTLYVLPFLRLLGTRVGPRAEVSTVSHIDPDLLTLGQECFVADLAVVGAARFINGFVILGETKVGARGFIGNAALVPGDTRLGHASLIGVLSVAPPLPVEPGSSWLGSPAIFLPRRQASAKFDDSLTYRPRPRLVVCRLAIESLRVVLPSALSFAAMFLIALATLRLSAVLPKVVLLLLLPAIYLACGAVVTLAVAALKWLVVGRYRQRVAPQWSHFVWRTELITGLYENVAVPWLLWWLAGTPLMGPVLRLFGTRVGRRVFMETTYLCEFDLVTVGDDAAVSGQASLQTHLFEDRVMKMSTVTVGAGCTVGSRAVILYDAELEAGAELDSLSLAMKGETLPAGSRWRGIPARPVD